MEWVNPAESPACRNSSTVPVGQLTGLSWRSLHHEVKSLHFRAYSFLVEGALDWCMVSTTLFESPEAMKLRPLRGHTHSFHNSGHSLWESPISRRGEKSGPRTILVLARTEPRPLSRQDVCSHIEMLRDVYRLQDVD